MTDCRQVLDRLPDYLYEILPDWQMEEITQHLATCEGCKAQFGAAVEEFRLLDEWQAEDVGEDGFSAFMCRVQEQAGTALRAQERPLVRRTREAHSDLAPRRSLVQIWRDLPMRTRIAAVSVSTAMVALFVALLLLPAWKAAVAQGKEADRERAIKALVAQNKLEDAVEACRSWIKEDGQATKPHLLLGDLCIRTKLWDKAEQEFRTVLDLNPMSATAHARLGDINRLRSKLPEADDEYHAALKMNDKCLEAYLGLATMTFAAGKPADAQPYIDMALQIAPDDPTVAAFAGEIDRQTGKLASAETRLKQALAASPTNPDVLYGLAACLQQEGKEDESQSYWDKFLAAEKGTDRAWLAKYGLVVLSEKEIGGSPGADQRPVFSPDGKMLAFQAHDDTDNQRGWEVWAMPADGSKPAQCLTTGGGAMFPRWTLDGKGLVFDFLYEPAGTKKRVCALTMAGGNPRCLTPDSELAYSATPIPGTDRFLFCDGFSLLTVGGLGADSRRLPISLPPGYQLMHLSVSPDAKNVVYCATNWPKDGQPDLQLYVSPLDGSAQPRLLTHEDVSDRIGSHYPEWGPDGKRILYSSDIDAPRKAHSTWVTVLDDPHEPCELIHPGGRATWSPDGMKIAFDRWTPHDPDQIFIVTLGGKRPPVVKP